mgnify:FL=1|tara:strand:+ start:5249 stop:6478 length:1230 start_codon:yes stop_codon:yes gene_type:complete
METIFIQIASYRDPELIPTIDNMLENADNPSGLKICIAHQHSDEDKWDTLLKYANDNRFIIIDIPYGDSLGACWARNQIQQHYNGEKYTLQIDSHHRFVKGWDTICIDMLKSLQNEGYNKPLLTGYMPSYFPDKDPVERGDKPCGMNFDRFTPEGVVFFLPYYLDETVTSPIPARFYSAHFAFTVGDFCKEVQHDPMFYFHGEEITIAVRAYTWGYDLFHPHKLINWHEYTRVGRVKQWDDDKDWHSKNEIAHSRTRRLLGVDGEVCSPCNKNAFKGYDIGSHRTIMDYEKYSGIRFKDRAITNSCSKNTLPSKGLNEPYFLKSKHQLTLRKDFFPEDDYEFAALIFEDKNGEPLNREDLSKVEINNLFVGTQESSTVRREYNGPDPHQWVLWPYSTSKGWINKRVFEI